MSDINRSEFSVCRWFPDGTYQYVCRFVYGLEAVATFKRLIESADAQTGSIVRVMITDGGDCSSMEWEFGKGIVFPPELVGKGISQ